MSIHLTLAPDPPPGGSNGSVNVTLSPVANRQAGPQRPTTLRGHVANDINNTSSSAVKNTAYTIGAAVLLVFSLIKAAFLALPSLAIKGARAELKIALEDAAGAFIVLTKSSLKAAKGWTVLAVSFGTGTLANFAFRIVVPPKKSPSSQKVNQEATQSRTQASAPSDNRSTRRWPPPTGPEGLRGQQMELELTRVTSKKKKIDEEN